MLKRLKVNKEMIMLYKKNFMKKNLNQLMKIFDLINILKYDYLKKT